MAKRRYQSPAVSKAARRPTQICACHCGSESGSGSGSGGAVATARTQKKGRK